MKKIDISDCVREAETSFLRRADGDTLEVTHARACAHCHEHSDVHALAMVWTGNYCELKHDGKIIHVVQVEPQSYISNDYWQAFDAFSKVPSLLAMVLEDDNYDKVNALHAESYDGSVLRFLVRSAKCLELLVGANFPEGMYDLTDGFDTVLQFMSLVAGARPRLDSSVCLMVSRPPRDSCVVEILVDGEHSGFAKLPDSHNNVLIVDGTFTMEPLMVAHEHGIANCYSKHSVTTEHDKRTSDICARTCLLSCRPTFAGYMY